MSIFKESFKPNIKAQLTKRQEALEKRDFSSIQYLNSRNAWIRMSSAVAVENDGGKLANANVLLGGALSNSSLRTGVGNTGTEAYSSQTTGGTPHRLGIRPMPGITGIEVKSKSAYGSLREVTVNFNCWDIKQLEDLELLYMRQGYTVLVEWGWIPYLDNNGALSSTVSFTDEVLEGKKPKEDIWKNLYTKSSENGNYDGMYGKIKNYSWAARPDGGYDCTTTIITMGEIIESLKVNYGISQTKIATTGVFGLVGDASLFLKDGRLNKAYNQNFLAGMLSEIWEIANTGANSVPDLTSKPITLKEDTCNFFKFRVDVAGKKENSEDSIQSSSNQIYIKLKDFLVLLNKYVLLSDGNKAIVEISVTEGNHQTPGKDLLCLGNRYQLSTDPTICQIKNMAWIDSKTNLGIDTDASNLVTLVKIMNALPDSDNYFNKGDWKDKQLGVIGNIYVNLAYMYSLVVDADLASQDKKEKKEISLYDFIKNMMLGINTAIGNVANFEIHVDPIDSVARIIDINYVDERSRETAYDDAFVLEMHNLRGTVRSYKLESQIFPEQSATVAIGAQVQGGTLGTDTSTLVAFNRSVTDRIVEKVEFTPKLQDTKEDDLKGKLENLMTSMGAIIDYISKIDPDWYEFTGDFDVNEASKYSGALRDIINFYKSFVKDDNKNRNIIPTKLSIEMDGIGGFIIGNLFRIPDDLLPRGYKGINGVGAKIAYIVTGIGHSVQNNDWVTHVDAQFIILDDPKNDTHGLSKEEAANITGKILKVITTEKDDQAVKDVKKIINNANNTNTNKGKNPTSGLSHSEDISVSKLDVSQFIYPVTSTVTSAFKVRAPIPGGVPGSEFHRAIDLGCPSGTPVYSVCDGVVTRAGAVSGYGNNAVYIKVDPKYHPGDPGPYYFIYGHGEKRYVEKGDKVTAGQQITDAGNQGLPGQKMGPHLHLQLRRSDEGRDSSTTSLLFAQYFPPEGGSIKAGTKWV
jgi:murein DD-endopeptidase MepM/ murein hydrolase activator NlpD